MVQARKPKADATLHSFFSPLVPLTLRVFTATQKVKKLEKGLRSHLSMKFTNTMYILGSSNGHLIQTVTVKWHMETLRRN